MSEQKTALGLTDEQSVQLYHLSEAYLQTIKGKGNPFENADIWFGYHIHNYLGSVAVEAQAKVHGHKASSEGIRRATMKAFESYLGRKPTGDDILGAVRSAGVTIDQPIAEAIQRDIERLTS